VALQYVAMGHFRTQASQQNQALIDHLVDAAEQCRGNRETQSLGGFQIDHQLVLDLVGVCTGRSAGFAPALISAIMGHAGAAQRQRPLRPKLGRSCGAVLAGASASVKSDAKCPRCLALHFWI